LRVEVRQFNVHQHQVKAGGLQGRKKARTIVCHGYRVSFFLQQADDHLFGVAGG
jgi:hypothetical protein